MNLSECLKLKEFIICNVGKFFRVLKSQHCTVVHRGFTEHGATFEFRCDKFLTEVLVSGEVFEKSLQKNLLLPGGNSCKKSFTQNVLESFYAWDQHVARESTGH